MVMRGDARSRPNLDHCDGQRDSEIGNGDSLKGRQPKTRCDCAHVHTGTIAPHLATIIGREADDDVLLRE
jgi:hypothetical protein